MATIQFNLRVPEELKNKIEEASAESGRSINAEATYRLEQSFAQEKPPTQVIDISNALMEIKAEIQSLKKPT